VAAAAEVSSPVTTETDQAPDNGEIEPEAPRGGVYFDLDAGVVFGLTSTHEWKDTCPQVEQLNWAPACSATKPIGGAIEARLGYRHTIVGFEAFGLVSGDYSKGELEGSAPGVPLPSFATDIQVGRLGAALGGGLRVMNNDWLRVSAGIGMGAMFRGVFTNVSSLDGSSEGYVAPLLKADLTLSLGKFLNLGLMGWIEFSKTIKVAPELDAAGNLTGGDPNLEAALDSIEQEMGQITLFAGPQYFLIPYLGLHFGK
jgi:hypothetical protein